MLKKSLLHEYQRFVVKHILDTPKCMLILDMGLGKTIATLTAIEDLMFNSFTVYKVLVIAPLRVAEATWSDEIAKWEHTTKLDVSKILGTETERIKAIDVKADIYLINRENLVWLVKYYKESKRKWDYDMIVIDESSSFKNHKAKRFGEIKNIAAKVPRVVLLTGTPAPNGLLNLWSQMYLVDKGARLGRFITHYRDNYFYPTKTHDHVVYEYGLKDGAEDTIYEKISDVAISMRAEDHIKVPERIDNVIELKMDEPTTKLYKRLKREYLITFADETVTGANAAVIANKLLQMANGACYTESGGFVEIHNLKLDALEEIIENNESRCVMVFYNFKHDLARLKQRFKGCKVGLENSDEISRWNNNEYPILLVHPASMGHGLNLQKADAIIVWFGLTYALENYLQANARLDRQGRNQTTVIHHLVVKDTQDEHAMDRLLSKSENQDKLIDAIKAQIKEVKGHER